MKYRRFIGSKTSSSATMNVAAAPRRAAAGGLSLAAYARNLTSLLKDRAVLGLCLMAAFRAMSQSGLLLFLPLYVADVMEASPVLVGATVMAMHLGGVIVSPIAGVVSDRIGRGEAGPMNSMPCRRRSS